MTEGMNERERMLAIKQKFTEHFQHIDAVALVVLKGHLLIEEVLDAILGKFVFHEEHLLDHTVNPHRHAGKERLP